MARNPFVNEYGGLSNEIMLNVAEILTLRLPEGTGNLKYNKIKFIIRIFGEVLVINI